MRSLKCFLLGAVAVGIVAYAVVAALAVTAQAAGRTLEIAVGPMQLVSVAESGGSTVTTFGIGLVVLAVIGGAVNLAAARLLGARPRRRGDRVD